MAKSAHRSRACLVVRRARGARSKGWTWFRATRQSPARWKVALARLDHTPGYTDWRPETCLAGDYIRASTPRAGGVARARHVLPTRTVGHARWLTAIPRGSFTRQG
jgi:hypothetical protein